MKYGIQEVTIRSLMRRPWLETEMRTRINEKKARQYAEEKEAGDEFPPPVVFCDPKTELYWVGDGFHRILAEHWNEKKVTTVDLRRGTQLDAIFYNIEANRTQRGLPFESGDKSRAVTVLLQRKECSDWSYTKIAETVGCHVSLPSIVAKRLGLLPPEMIEDKNGVLRMTPTPVNRENVIHRRNIVLAMTERGFSARDIALHLGVHRRTIGKDIDALSDRLIPCPHCKGTGKVKK